MAYVSVKDMRNINRPDRIFVFNSHRFGFKKKKKILVQSGEAKLTKNIATFEIYTYIHT